MGPLRWLCVLLVASTLLSSFAIAATSKAPIKLVDGDKLEEDLKNSGGPLGEIMTALSAVEDELGADFSTLDQKSAWVITGEELNGPERAALEAAKANSPKMFAGSVSASEVSLPDVKKSAKLVVLIGGPAQNSISRQLADEGILSKDRHEYLNQIVIVTGKSPAGGKFVVLSDKRGFVNMPRKAAAYSPLALCLPLQLVPVVASMFGALLASIITPLANLAQTYVENVIAERTKSKMAISHAKYKFAGIKAREVFAVVMASVVLALAISWTFAGPTWDLLWLLPLNVFVCLVAGFSHESVHWAAGRALKIETEYRFWLSGSLSTIFSAFLGNAFGLQGFLLDEVKEATPKWKVALMKISAPLFSAAVMVFFAAVNFFVPHTVFQMIYSISGVLAMAEMLPFKPMDGYEIRKWNILAWFVVFSGVGVLFLAANFII
ncbi:MAG: hypothetical protein V1875_03100 [Candidatus Altiarchaeota archaeon]